MLVVYIIALVIVLSLQGFIASNASDIAQVKGYDKKKWFHMCFWFGWIGYILVAAMPDLNLHAKQNEIISLLRLQAPQAQSSSSATPSALIKASISKVSDKADDPYNIK